MADLTIADVLPETTPPATDKGTSPDPATPVAPPVTAPTGQPAPQADLAGFATQEELVKGYQELRTWNTKLAMDVAELKKTPAPSPADTPKPTAQDLVNRFVTDPEGVLTQVRDSAVQEAQSRMSVSLAISTVIDRAKAENPDVVTPEFEPVLAGFARFAPISDPNDPVKSASERMTFAITKFKEMSTKIKEAGVKQGEDANSLKAKASFETGSIQVTQNPGFNKEAVLKIQRENPAEYERLWKANPQAMLKAFQG